MLNCGTEARFPQQSERASFIQADGSISAARSDPSRGNGKPSEIKRCCTSRTVAMVVS